ncbi:SulP family inorganic anion transporter [Nocardioides sambongensis]|uniref:SulP family inorganic anion transporter n=1 Tax=Nocardioides sambongensis TaxID=2589074 RepID=UPI00112D3D6E|nr:SulP family inorganic anion transporter [Nocardioides sambongensis]
MPTWLCPTLTPYRREWLKYDVVAGVAAGTVVVPQAMAYASIAGLPVEVGLYTCMLPVLVYALLGGSRTLSLSTTSTIAILTATTLGGLSPGRTLDDTMRAAFTLTLLVGAALLLMRLFRLGSLVEQISPATMTGVKTGVGLTVAVTQLPTLLGVSGDSDGDGFLGALGDTLSKLGDVSLVTAVVSAAAITALLVLRRVAPRLPAPLIVVGAGIGLVALTGVEDRGLALIDPVPSGLPTPTLPLWHDVTTLMPAAVAIALMAFMETVLVARAQRQRSEPPIDADQELLANGIAALAGGLSQCLPPAGGFSQSAVNQRSGARTQVAGATTAVLAVLVALLLAPILDDLPQAILAAMVMVAVLGLITPSEFVRLLRVDRAEFWVAVVTAVIGLTAGLLLAVAVGVLLTLVLVLRAFSESRVRPLYPRTGGGWSTNPPEIIDDHEAMDDLVLLHLDGSLYTGSARPTQDAVLAAAFTEPRPRALILECSAARRTSIPFLDVLEGLDADLGQEGITMFVTSMPHSALEVARRSEWFADFEARGHVLATVDGAIAAADAASPSGSPPQ